MQALLARLVPALLRILTVSRKEFLHLQRDWLTLLIILAVPTFLLVVFGYAASQEVKAVPTTVLDESQSVSSRNLTALVGNTREFNLLKQSEQEETVALIIIPKNYSSENGNGPTLIADGINPVTAGLLQAKFMQLLQFNRFLRQPFAAEATGVTPMGQFQALFNEKSNNNYFMIPGLLALILQNVTITLTAFAFVRERELGTLNRLLSTPLLPAEILIGKLLPYLGIALAEFCILLAFALVWFQIPMRGQWSHLSILTILFILSALGVGMLISLVSKTQLQAMQLTIVIVLPSIILSGFVFPLGNMPTAVRYLGDLIPLTFYLEILRSIMIRGISWQYLWPEIGHLCLLTGVVLCLLWQGLFPKFKGGAVDKKMV